MSRVAISLDQHALAELRKRAAANKEPVARTAARFVRDGLLSTQHTASESVLTPARDQPQPSGPPPWIEPATHPQRWRRELWASVVALHERYPAALGRLPADWWNDRALTEILAALALWRNQLDQGQHTDPRAELLYHDRLDILQRHLTQIGDPTAPRFTGGPPPEAWLAAPAKRGP